MVERILVNCVFLCFIKKVVFLLKITHLCKGIRNSTQNLKNVLISLDFLKSVNIKKGITKFPI